MFGYRCIVTNQLTITTITVFCIECTFTTLLTKHRELYITLIGNITQTCPRIYANLKVLILSY